MFGIGKRVISAAVGIILLVIILLSNQIFINFAVAVISVMALYELFSALGYARMQSLVFVACLGVIGLVFGNFIERAWIMPMVYFYMIFLFIIFLKNHKTMTLNHIAVTLFAVVYIGFFLSHIVFTRELEHGNILVWLIFLGAFMTDTWAFFVGVLFGKHKLFPEISPKKTIEGALGGIAGCMLCFWLYGLIFHRLAGWNLDYRNLIILGLLCSIVAQLGDLSASIIKRKCGVKDYGNIMPGHGGVLDRFDSIIFVAPLVYYFLLNFKVFI